MIYIYLITNNINNKIYIGQTSNLSLRWSQHKSNAKYNRGNQVITKAISKYGYQNFTFEVIAQAFDRKSADDLEEEIIKQYNSRNPEIGYNIAAGGNTTERTPEILNKISNSLTLYYKKNNNHMKGKSLPDDWKKNISKSSLGKPGTNKGRKFNKEWREKISKALTGKKVSEKTKKKLSESHIGHIAPNRKLTFEIAEEIRKEYGQGNVTQKQLAKKYCVSQDSIFNIIKNKTYKKNG